MSEVFIIIILLPVQNRCLLEQLFHLKKFSWKKPEDKNHIPLVAACGYDIRIHFFLANSWNLKKIILYLHHYKKGHDFLSVDLKVRVIYLIVESMEFLFLILSSGFYLGAS